MLPFFLQHSKKITNITLHLKTWLKQNRNISDTLRQNRKSIPIIAHGEKSKPPKKMSMLVFRIFTSQHQVNT